MTAETARWSQRYEKALRLHLSQGPAGSMQPALRLGRQGVTLGLKTLDVARIHQQAMTALPASEGTSADQQRTIEQGQRFFAETIVPLEANHPAALKATARINRLTQTKRRRAKELSVAVGQLEQAVAARQAAEAVLAKADDRHARLLAEALDLQQHLRRQTREILSAHEDGRQKSSCELRNEIAQALLGIDISLLALKTSATFNTENLEKEIANARRLVEQSSQRERG